MWEYLPTIITIASFVLTAGGVLVKVTHALDKAELSLREAITNTKDEVEERQDRMSREAGESVAAVRLKIHEVETWVRDNFIRRDDFDTMREDIVRMGDKLEARLVRMEGKIDARP